MNSLARYQAFVWALLVAWFAGVARAEKPAARINYDEQIVPILREKCFACHGQDRKSGGLRLNSYTSAMAGGASGEAIKPGDADGSLLYQLVTHQQEPHMPPRSPMLPAETLAVIKSWIEAGALENAGSKAKIVNKPKLEMSTSALAKGKPEGPPPMPENLSLEPIVHTPRPNAVVALATSPWAPVLAVGGQKQVLLYDTDSLVPLGVLSFPEGTPHVLKFSRNSKLLLAGGGHDGKSGRVVVWDIRTGKRVFEVGEESDAVLAADISPDLTQIALGGPSKVVRIYSTRDGALLREIKKHTDWITTLEYSPDGVLLATGDRASGLFVWEAFTGREYFMLRGHGLSVTDVSWRADGNVLASGSEDGGVRLWEMENGTSIKAIPAGQVQSVHFARDGRLAAASRDHVVRMWNANGSLAAMLSPLPDMALRVAFSHDAKHVFAGDWSGKVYVWTTSDGKLRGELSPNPVSVAEQIATATKDLTHLRDASTQQSAAAQASAAAAKHVADELAQVQRAAGDAVALARIINEERARTKQAIDHTTAQVAATSSLVAAREVVARAYSEANTKIAAAAMQAKDNKDLTAAAQKAQTMSKQAASELAAAQKALHDLQVTLQQAQSRFAEVQRLAVSTGAAAAAATKRAEQQAAAAKAAGAKAEADRIAAADTAFALARTQKLLDKLNSFSAVSASRK